MPLLTQVCGRDNENAPLTLSPSLRNNQSSFDGFAKANFISQ